METNNGKKDKKTHKQSKEVIFNGLNGKECYNLQRRRIIDTKQNSI